jgi:hypothetical protein
VPIKLMEGESFLHARTNVRMSIIKGEIFLMAGNIILQLVSMI